MGSLFSALQFFVSPKIGALSDKYGRKKILLLTMVGNILSALVWMKSTTFASYILSRVIGGLSEGNVQLAIAILSDITTPANRSKALAHVGIAFAICFCIGPPIGAYFATRPLPSTIDSLGFEMNIYALPAFITLVLLVLETIFLVIALPETRGVKVAEDAKQKQEAAGRVKSKSAQPTKRTAKHRLQTLNTLRNFHFFFLAIFSGVEFTLTFLTFDLLDWNNTQNGKLMGSIGVVSALLQGGYVRRQASKIGEGKMARRGVASCVLSFIFLGLMPLYVHSNPTLALRFLQLAAVCLAFTSATVVNCLTAFASFQCNDETADEGGSKYSAEHPDLAKGRALGKFRSSGQLGRALGPLVACGLYWSFGPSVTYSLSAITMLGLFITMKKIAARGSM